MPPIQSSWAPSRGLYFLNPIYNIVQYSCRLALIPDALQSRVNRVFRLIAFGTQPLGARLSGVLVHPFVTRLAVLVHATCLVLLAMDWIRRPLPVVCFY